MKALVINCSPVRAGATAEIGKIIARCLGIGMRSEVSVEEIIEFCSRI